MLTMAVMMNLSDGLTADQMAWWDCKLKDNPL
jgi:hypothetical protein